VVEVLEMVGLSANQTFLFYHKTFPRKSGSEGKGGDLDNMQKKEENIPRLLSLICVKIILAIFESSYFSVDVHRAQISFV
jgi:hypothetical protein